MADYDFYMSNKQIKADAKDVLSGSWNVACKGTFVVATILIVPIVATILLSIFVYWWLSIPLGIVCLLLCFVLQYGATEFYLGLSKGETPHISTVFRGFAKIGPVLSTAIKKLFLLLFWLALLIVPAFVKSIGYSMSSLAIATSNSKQTDALKVSAHLMKDNYKRYFKFLMSFAQWFLLFVCTAGIAGIWIAPYFSVCKSLFYENLKTDF